MKSIYVIEKYCRTNEDPAVSSILINHYQRIVPCIDQYSARWLRSGSSLSSLHSWSDGPQFFGLNSTPSLLACRLTLHNGGCRNKLTNGSWRKNASRSFLAIGEAMFGGGLIGTCFDSGWIGSGFGSTDHALTLEQSIGGIRGIAGRFAAERCEEFRILSGGKASFSIRFSLFSDERGHSPSIDGIDGRVFGPRFFTVDWRGATVGRDTSTPLIIFLLRLRWLDLTASTMLDSPLFGAS